MRRFVGIAGCVAAMMCVASTGANALSGSAQSGQKTTAAGSCKHNQTTPDVSCSGVVRFATFNASLNRRSAGALSRDLADGSNTQAQNVAETIQRNRPDVLLLNEFDYDSAGLAVDRFNRNYLQVGQRGADPITYPYVYVAASNTGVQSGFDLDNDGRVGGPGDAFGFGFFEGQYGMVVLSKFPIDVAGVRTFQNFRWQDMPGALLPDDLSTPEPADWYSADELKVVRLSSKSHWDVPIKINGRTVHFLTAHPTPPVFDGPEDRNGRRNHDEIRFWADYVSGKGGYIYDDQGRKGGLPSGQRFVIAGDLNADPRDGDSVPGAISQLTSLAQVRDPQPRSTGGVVAARVQGGANAGHLTNPGLDTADFADGKPGNLRVDYVLPSKRLSVINSRVYWPAPANPLSRLTGNYPFPTSDHRLVRVDVAVN